MTTTRRQMEFVADRLLGEVLDEMVREGRLSQTTADQIKSRLL